MLFKIIDDNSWKNESLNKLCLHYNIIIPISHIILSYKSDNIFQNNLFYFLNFSPSISYII